EVAPVSVVWVQVVCLFLFWIWGGFVGCLRKAGHVSRPLRDLSVVLTWRSGQHLAFGFRERVFREDFRPFERQKRPAGVPAGAFALFIIVQENT
ncbi:hypothetical protein, partial [Shimia ponticola]|uniref:hypothetical protein n=1 Tax=Shimia ponticola TaxID=2582893 RepID=UPI001C9B16A9